MLESINTHSTIVIHQEEEHYLNFKSEIKLSGIDFIYFDKEEGFLNLRMEDLSEIREFQSSKTSSRRFIILNRSIRNTVIQSAFLKLLEEPTENTYIVIFTNSLDMLLPTVLSRCQVIELNQESEEHINRVNIIINSRSADKFKKLERYLVAESLRSRGIIGDKHWNSYISIL